MPSRRTHLRASRQLLGYANPIVHDILDTQSPTLEHRYRHNPRTAHQIGEWFGKDAEREAWLHILTDWQIV